MNSTLVPRRRVRRKASLLRPYRGFGPWGWCLTLIAAALALSMLTGYDLRHKLLELINHYFGWTQTVLFVTIYLVGQNAALSLAVFGPTTLTYTLAAMHIEPRRQPWWTWTAASVWAILGPWLWWHIALILYSRGRSMGLSILPTITDSEGSLEACIIMAVPTTLVLLILTRSWIVAAVSLLSCIAWTWLESCVLKKLSIYPIEPALLPVLFNLTTAAAMFCVALARRRRYVPPGGCPACGYDTTGLVPPTPCPECGTIFPTLAPS